MLIVHNLFILNHIKYCINMKSNGQPCGDPCGIRICIFNGAA